MNRVDLQNLAELGLLDAAALLAANRFAGAYYLAGYVIECALKACFAKQTLAEDFPPKPKIVQNLYTHDLEALLNAAGLKSQLDADAKKNLGLEVSWGLVAEWREDARYNSAISKQKAEELLEAVGDPAKGVLPWLRVRW